MSELACYRCETDLDRDDLNEPTYHEGGERFLCDTCWLATRILLYSRPEPPYVDIGLYQEVVFYARMLAARSLPDPPKEVVALEGAEEADG